MSLSKYFSAQEARVSEAAARRGIDNTPPASIMGNVLYAAKYMDQIRELLGHPVTILSWYRCPEVNRLVGGSKTSDHVKGLAVDFICPGYGSPLSVACGIKTAKLPYQQLIHEFQEWVHISFSLGSPKGEELTAVRVNNRTVYRTGLV